MFLSKIMTTKYDSGVQINSDQNAFEVLYNF